VILSGHHPLDYALTLRGGSRESREEGGKEGGESGGREEERRRKEGEGMAILIILGLPWLCYPLRDPLWPPSPRREKL
jgi:hypothetical protein